MHKALITLWLATIMAFTSLLASAEVDQQDPAFEAVKTAVANGDSAESIIRMLIAEPYGKTLAEATVYAMVAGGQENRTAMIEAGIGLATTLPQAQQVAYAVEAAAGSASADAGTARDAVAEYAQNMPPPEVYQQNYSPTGGGTDVSPS